MIIQRAIHERVKELMKYFPVLSITGPRQAGKTTFLREMFPDYTYLSMEDIDTRSFARDNPREFLEKYANQVIIDEAQRVPDIFSYIQGKVDNDKIMGQYILSGSQNFLLLEKITQSLAGRVAIFRLLPFSFEELLSAEKFESDWKKLAHQGFYPTIYDRGINPDFYYPNYLETYVERDIREVVNIQNLGLFQDFVKLCAGRVGQLLNLNSLATDCGISQPTAKAWLSLLESSYIIYQLRPYYKNFNKRIQKSPKLYFYDTGLLCNLLAIKASQDLQMHYARGSIFENMIISELLKKCYNHTYRPDFYFYRDSNGNEIDLIWEHNQQIDMLEIKSGATINDDFFKGINQFKKTLGPASTGNAYLVYGGNQTQRRSQAQVIGWQDVNNIEL